MKKNKFWFTLIELIVVISIITVLTSSGVLSFFGFLESQKITINIDSISEEISLLDKKINNHDIYDYELFFSSWSLWYYYYVNKFDIPYGHTIEMDFNSWTWVIKTNAISSWWIRILKIYKKHKLFIDRITDWMDVFTWSLNETKNYKIIWTLSWELLNEIYVNYYIENNIIKENEDFLELIKIDSDSIWTVCTEIVKIENIWWNKKIFCWNSIVNKIFLHFEQNWIEKYIEINK